MPSSSLDKKLKLKWFSIILAFDAIQAALLGAGTIFKIKSQFLVLITLPAIAVSLPFTNSIIYKKLFYYDETFLILTIFLFALASWKLDFGKWLMVFLSLHAVWFLYGFYGSLSLSSWGGDN